MTAATQALARNGKLARNRSCQVSFRGMGHFSCLQLDWCCSVVLSLTTLVFGAWRSKPLVDVGVFGFVLHGMLVNARLRSDCVSRAIA